MDDFLERIKEAYYEDKDVYSPLEAASREFVDVEETPNPEEINDSTKRDNEAVVMFTEKQLIINDAPYKTVAMSKTDDGYLISVESETQAGEFEISQSNMNELMYEGKTVINLGDMGNTLLTICVPVTLPDDRPYNPDSPQAPAKQPSNSNPNSPPGNSDGVYHLKY